MNRPTSTLPQTLEISTKSKFQAKAWRLGHDSKRACSEGVGLGSSTRTSFQILHVDEKESISLGLSVTLRLPNGGGAATTSGYDCKSVVYIIYRRLGETELHITLLQGICTDSAGGSARMPCKALHKRGTTKSRYFLQVNRTAPPPSHTCSWKLKQDAVWGIAVLAPSFTLWQLGGECFGPGQDPEMPRTAKGVTAT